MGEGSWRSSRRSSVSSSVWQRSPRATLHANAPRLASPWWKRVKYRPWRWSMMLRRAASDMARGDTCSTAASRRRRRRSRTRRAFPARVTPPPRPRRSRGPAAAAYPGCRTAGSRGWAPAATGRPCDVAPGIRRGRSRGAAQGPPAVCVRVLPRPLLLEEGVHASRGAPPRPGCLA